MVFSRIVMAITAMYSLSMNSCSAADIKTHLPAATPQKFKTIYEPSGGIQLPNGDLLIVQDEAARAITQVKLEGSWEENRLMAGFTPLEDLEGISQDDNHIYVVTSHAKTQKNKLPGARQKLVRFELKDGKIVNVITVRNLKKSILKAYPNIADEIKGKRRDLNIEAISVNRATQHLMIGLRSPVIDNSAVILPLKNPDQVFGEGDRIKFSNKLISLDLDGGGIRAMAFDDHLNGYLIISRRENKNGKPFKLWYWTGERGSKPKRVRLPEHLELQFAEGIIPLRTDSFEALLILKDDGDSLARRGGHYTFITYDQIIMGLQPRG